MTDRATSLTNVSRETLHCFGVVPACLAGYWAEAWALLEPAVARNGLYTRQSVLAGLVKGEFQLWVAQEPAQAGQIGRIVLAAVTEIAAYPACRIASVQLLGGKRLEHALPFLDTIEAWARENGCHRFVNEGRGGLAKKLEKRGYRMESIRMVKDLAALNASAVLSLPISGVGHA